jgi:hypothetical protein
MFYKVSNLGNVEYFDSELAANTKLAEIQKAYLEQNDYVFTIAKEVVNGNETTWMNADLENDPEDHTYHVFNTLTGLHEETISLSEAKKLQERIKQEFIADANIDKFEIVETKPKNLELYSINDGKIKILNTNEPFTI